MLCLAGKSNSGEGGEDPQRWENLADVDAEGKSPTFPHLKGLQEGDVASSRIKQVLCDAADLTLELCQSTEMASGQPWVGLCTMHDTVPASHTYHESEHQTVWRNRRC